jgi:methyl-accepting chemotaxis protein
MAHSFGIKNISLKINLLVPIALVFLVIFILFITLYIIGEQNKKSADFEQMMANTTEIVALTNVSNIWNFDIPALEQNFASFMKNKEVISIEIRDTKDASIKKAEKEKKEHLVVKSLDIIREDQKLGTVRIEFTDYYIRQDIDAMTRTFILMGLTMFAATAGFLLLITWFLSAPITRLMKIARRIAEGETDLDVSLEKTRSREITNLAQAFASMTTQLRKKAEGFKNTNDMLSEVIGKAREIIVSLNSTSKEIEAASQEQTTGSNEQASGITEVSATLEELSITAKRRGDQTPAHRGTGSFKERSTAR